MTDEARIAEVLEALRMELRRQGRAAIAAQAAAEACLEMLQRPPAPAAAAAKDEAWVNPLLPALDALERVRQHAEKVANAPAVPGGWLQRLRRARSEDEATGLAARVLLLAEQFESALRDAGLAPARPARGDPFDAAVHRAVGRVPGPAETVVEVVRSGYRYRDRLVREADVIVGEDS
ncbi:MAG: nucleotide exchange factor GrpE [Myxococcota bacterium]